MILPVIFAQTATQPSPGASGAGTLFMFGSIFAIFYFLLIRPQQKQRKQHEALIMTIKKGDQIVTAGGIVGEVIHIKETMKDGVAAPSLADHVTIKSAESRLVVTRGRIVSVGGEASGVQ
jgi:preprotein translocase subunit YajC